MRCSTRPLIALTMMLPLIGCASTTPEFVHVCPAIVTYSAAQQDAWGREVKASPPGSMLRTITDDYIGLRDQARACGG